MLKTKHIDAARETRLWISNLIIPAATAVILIVSNPDARRWVGTKFRNMKTRFSKGKEADYDQQIDMGFSLYTYGNRINNQGCGYYSRNPVVNSVVYVISMVQRSLNAASFLFARNLQRI